MLVALADNSLRCYDTGRSGLSVRAGTQGFPPDILSYISGYCDRKTAGATTEYRATLVHLIYMCRRLLKDEEYNNRHYCYSVVCK